MKTRILRLALLWSAVAGVFCVGSAAQKQVREVRLSAICRGGGTIETTNYNGKYLAVGSSYTMVARPGTGWVFTNWTDGFDVVVTNQTRLTFKMTANSSFIANFVKNTGLPLALDGVSIADIPLKVLAAVNAAPAGKQPQVLAEWMETVAAVHPSALPSALTTVVTAHPELMAAALTSALTAGPARVCALVQAAAQIPKADITNIVVTACTALPAQAYQIVQAVLNVDPKVGREVLLAVAKAVPELAAAINTALTAEPGPSSEKRALLILSHSLTTISWPVIPGYPDENPHDYSRP